MIVTCPKCGAKNRIEDRPGMAPLCGKCAARLPAAAGVIEVSDATFQNVIDSAGDVPVLIDCWAPWCGPCRMLTPTIDQIAAESQGRWIIGKLNVDENPRVAQQFQISSIPALLIFHHAQLVDRIVGLKPKAAIVSRLERISPAPV